VHRGNGSRGRPGARRPPGPGSIAAGITEPGLSGEEIIALKDSGVIL
jgi:hypothetical protein